MANENFSPTSNQGRGNLTGGVSSAEDGAQIVLRLDPTTKRLLVDTSISSYTGVTDGDMLEGVRFFSGGATTHSIVMRSKTRTIRFIEAEHHFDFKADFEF